MKPASLQAWALLASVAFWLSGAYWPAAIVVVAIILADAWIRTTEEKWYIPEEDGDPNRDDVPEEEVRRFTLMGGGRQ